MMNKFIKSLMIASIGLMFGLTSCNQAPTVERSNDRLVTGISLNPDEKELNPGESFKIVPTITYKDNKEVDVFKKFVSGDTSVATVDQLGNVTAVKSGTCDISFIAGYKQELCHVHVKGDDPGPIPPTPGEFTITLDRASISLLAGEKDKLYARTSEPCTVTWSSTDDTVVSVDQDGNIEALAGGYATIIASANGKSASCNVSVDEESEFDCTIYFFIDYNNIDEYDTTGTKLLKKFDWYQGVVIPQEMYPVNPSTPMDPAFPRFLGWSAHTIIDDVKDLWNKETDVCEANYLYLYGIWVEA